MTAPPASPSRRMMAERLKIGQKWTRNRDGWTGVVVQVWRPDREAMLVSRGGLLREVVPFADLRRKWREVA